LRIPGYSAFVRGLSALFLGALLSLSAGGGCGSGSTDDPCPDASTTIGEYCDQLLPGMCTYAVDTCGVGGTVSSCLEKARPVCCQGACRRKACPPAAGVIEACLRAYVGDAPDVDGGEGSAGPLPCDKVRAGLAPRECQSIVRLVSFSPDDTAR
jgi:hypothetical protein